MKRFLFPLLVSLAVAAPLAAASSRYLVLMRAPLHRSHIRMINEVSEAAEHEVRTFRTIDAFAADLSDADVDALRASGEVKVIEPIMERHLNDGTPLGDVVATTATRHAATPSESPFTHQVVPYGISLVQAPSVWTVGRGASVNVAILDTGVDYTHPDLIANYAGGYNTYENNDLPMDDHRHGTHVAGTVAAVDNAVGVVGVAPNARVWAVKVLDPTGFGDNEHIALGIDWVIAKKRAVGGNWVISMSLGSTQSSAIEEAAVKRAQTEGILVVAAAGNSSMAFLDFPAAYAGVMGIGAIDADKSLARFTNSGANMSVVAPGVNVISTVPIGQSYVADVQSNLGDLFAAYALKGSPRIDAEGDFVVCGFGHPEEIPTNIAGKVAIIRRGQITFNEKVRNAKAAGAKGVVILNGKDNVEDMNIWTLVLPACDETGCRDNPDDINFAWPLTVGLSYNDGQALLALVGKAQTITASYRADDYARFSGTSMATPHVTGVAALVWSLNPNLTAYDVRDAIEATADDGGAPGYDLAYGHGIVDALAAAKRVAPEKFGISLPPRRRGTGH